MDATNRERLTRIMSRMASGDEAAAVTLFLEFGDAVKAAVRRHLRAQRAHHLERDLDGIALDVCLDLAARAGSWDPGGGALPWVWADRRVRGIVARHAGTYGRELDEAGPRARAADEAGPPPAFTGEDLDEDAALAALAARHPACALLADALGRLAERDRRVFLLFETQKASGDPSPAVTTGAAHGLRPDNVRQIARRTRQRLLRLAATEARFAPLAGLPLLGGDGGLLRGAA